MRYETCPSECAAMNHPGEEHEARVISDEAVEAAAQRLYQSDGLNLWGKEDESVRSHYSRKARAALEAAAPHMLRDAKADAWDEGVGDMHEEAYRGVAAVNPYRSQA